MINIKHNISNANIVSVMRVDTNVIDYSLSNIFWTVAQRFVDFVQRTFRFFSLYFRFSNWLIFVIVYLL